MDELSEAEGAQLIQTLNHIQVEDIKENHKQAMKQQENVTTAATSASSSITPFHSVTDLSSVPPSQSSAWYSSGLSLLAEGHAAALLMAGGQGTRLGSSQPKGCFDINLLSHKSLFQIQAERLVRLRELAAAHAKKPVEDVHIKWYIMTSMATHAATESFFRSHSFFGLPSSDVFFFEQSELPALDMEGKIIMEEKYKPAMAPNGNGGIFEAMHRQGAIKHMMDHGVRYLHVYGVDNVLAKVADPTFIGFAVDKQADCANKVVLKRDPHEKVGVMCLRDGRPSVVEYSELPAAMSEARDGNGALLYGAANIVQHFFTIDFIKQQINTPLAYHVARKAIPHIDGKGERIVPKSPNGLKLEMFVFDAFERSQQLHCMAVPRDEEFSPVKNAAAPLATSGDTKQKRVIVADSPDTARKDVEALHIKLLKRAGANVQLPPSDAECDVTTACLCEISPLVSYGGEGLQDIVNGKTITLPCHIDTDAAKQLRGTA